jgi:hypothetical protein
MERDGRGGGVHEVRGCDGGRQGRGGRERRDGVDAPVVALEHAAYLPRPTAKTRIGARRQHRRGDPRSLHVPLFARPPTAATADGARAALR